MHQLTDRRNGQAAPAKSEILDRQPPADVPSERALIGSLLLLGAMPTEARALKTSDFYDGESQTVWRFALSLAGRGQPIDITLLAGLMTDGGTEHAPAVLAGLLNGATATNWRAYLARVADCSTRRRYIQTFTEGLQRAYSGASVESLRRHVEDSLIATESPRETIAPIDVEQLIEENPQLAEPLIEGILRRGEVANIVAPSKAGKSWFMYCLILSIVTGADWLGRFRCTPGRVLLLDNELHKTTLAYRLRTVANAMGIDFPYFRGMFDVVSMRGRLMTLSDIVRWLEKFPPNTWDTVVVDATYRTLARDEDENSNGDITNRYNLIDSECIRMGCCWINVLHSSKGEQGSKSVTDTGSGAGAQSRAPDSHLVMRAHEQPSVAVFEGALRSWAPIEPLALRWSWPLWSVDETIDTTKLLGKLTKAETRQTEKDSQGMRDITAALLTGALTAKKLRAKASLSPDRLDRLLSKMEDAGEVKSEEVKVCGNKCVQWSLIEGVDD